MGSAIPLALEKSRTIFISHANPSGCQPVCLVSVGAACPTSVHPMQGCVIKSGKAGSETLQPDKLVQEDSVVAKPSPYWFCWEPRLPEAYTSALSWASSVPATGCAPAWVSQFPDLA